MARAISDDQHGRWQREQFGLYLEVPETVVGGSNTVYPVADRQDYVAPVPTS